MIRAWLPQGTLLGLATVTLRLTPRPGRVSIMAQASRPMDSDGIMDLECTRLGPGYGSLALYERPGPKIPVDIQVPATLSSRRDTAASTQSLC
jgi:hypothetical protein